MSKNLESIVIIKCWQMKRDEKPATRRRLVRWNTVKLTNSGNSSWSYLVFHGHVCWKLKAVDHRRRCGKRTSIKVDDIHFRRWIESEIDKQPREVVTPSSQGSQVFPITAKISLKLNTTQSSHLNFLFLSRRTWKAGFWDAPKVNST